jgi:hypothetical protein
LCHPCWGGSERGSKRRQIWPEKREKSEERGGNASLFRVEIGVQRSRGERREIPIGDRVGKKERRRSNAILSRGEIGMRKIVKRKEG